MSLKTLSDNWSKTQCLLVVVGPLTELAAPSSALWARHVWLYNSAPVGFVLQLRPRLPWLLYTIIHAGDELEGNPFKYGEQYPRGKKKKSFSPGQVKGEGGVTPRLLWKPRVTRKTQFSDVIRRRNVLGWGLIYLCGAEGLNSCVQLGLFRVDFMAPKSVPVL